MANPHGVVHPAADVAQDSTPLPGDLAPQYVHLQTDVGNGDFFIPPHKVPVGVRVLMVTALMSSVSSLVLLLIAHTITPLARSRQYDGFRQIAMLLGIGLTLHLLIISTNVHRLRRSFGTALSSLPLSTSCLFEGTTIAIVSYFGIYVLDHGFHRGNTGGWPRTALIFVMAAAIIALHSCLASLLVLLVRMVGVYRGRQWAGRAGRVSTGVPVGNFRFLFSVNVLRREGHVRL